MERELRVAINLLLWQSWIGTIYVIFGLLLGSWPHICDISDIVALINFFDNITGIGSNFW